MKVGVAGADPPVIRHIPVRGEFRAKGPGGRAIHKMRRQNQVGNSLLGSEVRRLRGYRLQIPIEAGESSHVQGDTLVRQRTVASLEVAELLGFDTRVSECPDYREGSANRDARYVVLE